MRTIANENRRHATGRLALGIGAAALLGLAACGSDDAGDTSSSGGAESTASAEQAGATGEDGADADADATAKVLDESGKELGTVSFAEVDGATEVTASLEGLDPGFYGFHIHDTGQCEPHGTDEDGEHAAFHSAGSHLNPDDADHPDHAGDMPSLLVMENGKAETSFQTDRFTPEDLSADGGTAVMIHAGADNFAHIPERYAPAPDEDSLKTGDAGDRVGCGVVDAA